MNDPSPDTEVTLIVDLRVDDAAEAVDRVNAIESATVEETLPFGSMAISILESDLQQLCNLDVVASVEIEGEGRVLESGNP